ncbi:hypothetical protein I862_06250 [endosymbiont of Acanthamoeba sp. UWC8]|uniref:SspB family protein n=1 Tax=endosymbiont of Acanthamoeba sp. UWC8 TaxID=86106 RepID=UPI0004D19427|nr:ClpXP protease specificity-enhancing factor SspB [endosymbiont of Acanthamoeba sp. UWC8]AIF81804.1 hypothetical protein I862_06250 [endosymbiont of Acanthamoeba sp. UWC8]
MSRNIIDYGKLVDEAMHIIVCKVLKVVEKNGLPGEHHFFISFITKHPAVKISKALLEKYPREMTIVLQYQYQDLKVDNKGFGVTLSFNGHKESVYIPYSAVTTFADPSVQFGLQFREIEYDYDEVDIEFLDDEEFEDEQANINHSLKSKSKGEKREKRDKKAEGNNVISLDQFRKK